MARSIFISQIRDTGNILAGLTTANLVEGSNLYFTNARVYSNVIALLPTLAGSGIQIQANGQINSNTTLTLASLSPFLTTSNVAEGSNLYYTNARVRSALSGGTGVSYDNSTGAISIGQNVSSTADVTFTNLTVSGDLVVQGNTVTLNASTVNIEDKNLLLANGAINAAAADGAGITIYGANANITYVNATNSWNLNKDIIVTSNINAGNINVPRIVNNGTYNTSIELGSASGVIAVTTDGNATQFLPGGQIRLSPGGAKTILGGSYDGSQIVLGETQTDLVQNRGGAVTVQVGAEGATTNTWTFTNSGNLLAPGAISANNIIADSITSNTWNRLYTANVIESDSNLYYTNARVLSALTGNVTIGNLTLTGNITGGPALRSYVNSYKGNSESATITLPIAPISSNFVTVIINGVAQLSSAYTVSGNVLTFTSYPTTNADIDVRILDVTQPIVGEATAQEQLHPFLLSLL